MSCCHRRCHVRKLAVLLIVAGAVCAAVMRKKHRSGASRPSMWDKMRQHMEEMPEDFPPRVMFDNVAATKETTERILEILEEGGPVAGQEEAAEPDPN